MLFLAAEEESSILLSLIRTLLLDICNIIYKLIITFYELFLAVGDATILNSSQIQPIFSRVGLILGIIMLFRLIFSFVQYMIDPDKITDKEAGVGGLIKKILIVIVALGTSEWMFTKAFDIQHIILKENTIGKIVLGVSNNDDVDMGDFGVIFSYSLFENFFYQNPGLTDEAIDKANSKGCGPDYFDGNNSTMKRYIATFKDFEIAHQCVNSAGSIDGSLTAPWGNKVYYVNFDGLTAIVVGGFVLWVLIMYTITLGVRVVKLAFLRIIAPVPILSYLSPKKDTAFQRWIKQCITTYLDLFIRLAIIYFAMYLISEIFKAEEGGLNAATWLEPNSSLYTWFRIILVLGILLFAKKVPDLISDLFPGLGSKGGLDFGFGLKSRTDFLGKGLVKRAVGATAGAIGIGAVGIGQYAYRRSKVPKDKRKNPVLGAMGAFATGAARGIYHGAHGGSIRGNLGKAFSAQAKESETLYELEKSGVYDPVKRYAHLLLARFGLPGAIEELKQQAEAHKAQAESAEEVSNLIDKAIAGFDTSVDRGKNQIATNTTKATTVGNMPDFVTRLEKDGFVKRQLVDVAKADGSIVREERIMSKFGDDISNLKVGQLDDYFKNKHANASKEIEIALSTKANRADQQVLLNSQLEKVNIDISDINSKISAEGDADKKAALLKTRDELDNKRSQIELEMKANRDIITNQDRIIAERTALLSELSLADIEKKFAEALQPEIIKATYNDPTARTAIASAISGTNQLLSRIKIEIDNAPPTIDGSPNVIIEQVSDTHSVVGNLNKKMEELMKPENANMSFADLFANNEGWFTKNSDGSITIKRVDFDAPKMADGKYPEVTETISDIFDIEDKIKTILASYKNYENEVAREHRVKESDIIKSQEYLQLSQYNSGRK